VKKKNIRHGRHNVIKLRPNFEHQIKNIEF